MTTPIITCIFCAGELPEPKGVWPIGIKRKGICPKCKAIQTACGRIGEAKK